MTFNCHVKSQWYKSPWKQRIKSLLFKKWTDFNRWWISRTVLCKLYSFSYSFTQLFITIKRPRVEYLLSFSVANTILYYYPARLLTRYRPILPRPIIPPEIFQFDGNHESHDIDRNDNISNSLPIILPQIFQLDDKHEGHHTVQMEIISNYSLSPGNLFLRKCGSQTETTSVIRCC